MPWKTWTPASSRLRAQRMLEASSKRAMSSTTTVTSLFCAASTSAWKMGESLLVRYRVCLIERTRGSCGGGLDEADDAVVGVEGVMEHDVAVAEVVEEIGGFAAEAHLARHKGLEFEIGRGRCRCRGSSTARG